jgi:hypothetical protein
MPRHGGPVDQRHPGVLACGIVAGACRRDVRCPLSRPRSGAGKGGDRARQPAGDSCSCARDHIGSRAGAGRRRRPAGARRGGLGATARYFGRILHSALQRLELCSNDPICADHEPTSTADDRALHGAACHGCLLIAETSCEACNLFLDRALLVETMTGQQSGFFSISA